VKVGKSAVVMKYNLLREKEFSTYDASLDARFFFDEKRNFYLLDKEYIHDLNTGIPLYYYQVSMKTFKEGNQ